MGRPTAFPFYGGSMAKKKRNLACFPLLALASPFCIFLALFLIRVARGGTAQNYWNNFILLYDVLQNFREYLFPCFLYFTMGLLFVLLNHCLKKAPLSKKLWLFLVFSGTLIILIGSRLLFLYANDLLLSPQMLHFLKTGIDIYTFTAALIFCLLISFILQLLDVLYFNAK